MTWVMWNLSSFYLEVVLASVQDRCMVCTRRTVAQKSFWSHPMVPLGDKAKWKLVSVRLEIELILAQDRCTVCIESNIGSEIILHASDGAPWCRGSCGISLLSV